MMTNKKCGVLYIGYSNDIESRVIEHKTKVNRKSFTARYNCKKLVYLEKHNSKEDAEKRESQLKKWKRVWKIELIETINPEWMDIAINWNESNHLTLKSKRVKATLDFHRNAKAISDNKNSYE
jgi:putative endonuclease